LNTPSRSATVGALVLEGADQTRGTTRRLGQFIALTKPRVMSLAVFTALVGLLTAPQHLRLASAVVAIVCIALGAGAAGALNMWYEADIDGLMIRTSSRPIPRGKVSRREALVFGLLLAVGATIALGAAANLAAAMLLAFAIFFYVVVYTTWLKRRSPQSIVIGGVAGALPPVIGWVATGAPVSLQPFLLFLIIFLWTPPHFWALSIECSKDYARAGIPALPVVAGREKTERQILLYSVLLALASVLPWALGRTGSWYGVVAVLLGSVFVGLALKMHRSERAEPHAARRLFAFSIIYLFLLFASLLLDDVVRFDRGIAAAFDTTTALLG
jgi:heme o synthase